MDWLGWLGKVLVGPFFLVLGRAFLRGISGTGCLLVWVGFHFLLSPNGLKNIRGSDYVTSGISERLIKG